MPLPIRLEQSYNHNKGGNKRTCGGLAFLGVGSSVGAENVGGEALADGQSCSLCCAIATGVRRWKRKRLIRDAVGCRESGTRLQRFHLKKSVNHGEAIGRVQHS